ncbi:hypothetical protein M8J77_002054 [Diaphorina citri]|nr:hypothetical protein M8J77_002054 [Diaphorina citri]
MSEELLLADIDDLSDDDKSGKSQLGKSAAAWSEVKDPNLLSPSAAIQHPSADPDDETSFSSRPSSSHDSAKTVLTAVAQVHTNKGLDVSSEEEIGAGAEVLDHDEKERQTRTVHHGAPLFQTRAASFDHAPDLSTQPGQTSRPQSRQSVNQDGDAGGGGGRAGGVTSVTGVRGVNEIQKETESDLRKPSLGNTTAFDSRRPSVADTSEGSRSQTPHSDTRSYRERLKDRIQTVKEKASSSVFTTQSRSRLRQKLMKQHSTLSQMSDMLKKEEAQVVAALEKHNQIKSKWKTVTRASLEIAQSDEAFDFFTKVWDDEKETQPSGEPPKSSSETSSPKASEPQAAPAEITSDGEDKAKLGAADYLGLRTEDTEWSLTTKWMPAIDKVISGPNTWIYYPSTEPVPLQEKLPDNSELRHEENEGIFVPEKPPVSEKNYNKLQQRLLAEKNTKWFGEDGEVIRESDPLLGNSYRPPIVDSTPSHGLDLVFVPVLVPLHGSQSCSTTPVVSYGYQSCSPNSNTVMSFHGSQSSTPNPVTSNHGSHSSLIPRMSRKGSQSSAKVSLVRSQSSSPAVPPRGSQSQGSTISPQSTTSPVPLVTYTGSQTASSKSPLNGSQTNSQAPAFPSTPSSSHSGDDGFHLVTNRKAKVHTISTCSSDSSDITIVSKNSKKSKKRPKTSQDGIPLANKFQALSNQQVQDDTDMGTEDPVTKVKIPPMFVLKFGIPVLGDFIKWLKNASPDFAIKDMKEFFRLDCKTIDVYRQFSSLLDSKGVEYHSYRLPMDRTTDVVIKNVPTSFDEEEISEELKALGFQNFKLMRVWNREKKPIPVVNLYLDKKIQKNNEIYDLTKLMNCIVYVEPKKKSYQVPQCGKCQRYGHTKNYCRQAPRCVYCSGSHSTSDCTSKNVTPAVCVNCGENHTANYKGCKYYVELKKKRISDTRQLVQHSTVHSSPAPDLSNFPPISRSSASPAVRHVVSDHTYAQLLSSPTSSQHNQPSSQSNQQRPGSIQDSSQADSSQPSDNSSLFDSLLDSLVSAIKPFFLSLWAKIKPVFQNLIFQLLNGSG